MKKNFLLSSFLFLISIVSFALPVLAGPVSNNYELKEYGFGAGGTENSTSTNYKVLGVAGEVESSKSTSTNYQAGAGLVYTMMANVPPAPAFTNPANYYNKLHLILNTGGNPTDTLFAIAISTDNFASDTKYVQADRTPGSAPVWQNYSSWGGGTGIDVIGLLPNQAYFVKVAAKQGNFTVGPFGPVSTVSTDYPLITFSISGVSSGTSIEGISTDITTTAAQASYGELQFDQVLEAASLLSVTTSANSGYTVAVSQTGDLVTVDNIVFPKVAGTNALPDIWPTSVTNGAYGYHTSDHSLGTGNTSRFTSNNTYAKFETTPREIAYNGGPVTSDTTYMIYAIEVGKGQPAGSYSHTINYIATGVF